MPACSVTTRKSVQLLDVSFQSLAPSHALCFSCTSGSSMICFYGLCVWDLLFSFLIFQIIYLKKVNYGRINICPKPQCELGSCPLCKKFLFCCQGLIIFTVVLLCFSLLQSSNLRVWGKLFVTANKLLLYHP